MRDRPKDDRPRLAERGRDRVGSDPLRARLESQMTTAVDVAERERRRDRAIERVQLDAELCAPRREPVPLLRAHPGEKCDPVAQACRGGRRLGRRAPDAPLGITLELVACRVSYRDQVKDHTMNRA